MDFQNVNTKGLELMQTKDALTFLKTLTSHKSFTEAKSVFTSLNSVIVDKKFPKMDNITLLVQTFDSKEEDGKYFILTQSRGNQCSTSNCVIVKEVDAEEWRMETHFIKRYNELV